MSNPLRVGLVAEGITDYEVIDAPIESMLDGRAYILNLLQPEGSVAFTDGGAAGVFGGGWKGVRRWCLQAAERGGGKLGGDSFFLSNDLLILHLDADVAAEDPANHPEFPIEALRGVLPCAKPCPPPGATADALRRVLLGWAGEATTPPKTVLCTPSKSTEAWVMWVCFPDDAEMRRLGWECHPNPEIRLGQQPKRHRFGKHRKDYKKRHGDFVAAWPRLAGALSEARRFQDDFQTAVK